MIRWSLGTYAESTEQTKYGFPVAGVIQTNGLQRQDPYTQRDTPRYTFLSGQFRPRNTPLDAKRAALGERTAVPDAGPGGLARVGNVVLAQIHVGNPPKQPDIINSVRVPDHRVYGESPQAAGTELEIDGFILLVDIHSDRWRTAALC